MYTQASKQLSAVDAAINSLHCFSFRIWQIISYVI